MNAPVSPLYTIQVGATPFDYLNPLNHKFNLRDAVRAISFIPRFGGHAQGYTVAQHSVLVSVIATTRPWDGLAHDLAEAYYGDIPTPLKRRLKEIPPIYRMLEEIDMAVEDAFLFTGTREPSVKKADLVALSTERRDLLPKSELCEPYWADLPKPLDYTIVPLTPVEAERAWWRQYHKLVEQGKAPKFKDIPPPEKASCAPPTN